MIQYLSKKELEDIFKKPEGETEIFTILSPSEFPKDEEILQMIVDAGKVKE